MSEAVNFSQKRVVTGAMWTVGAYGLSVCLRFVSNVILSRIVAPEVFGVLMIVFTLKNGMELVTDVGIGQSVVRNPNAENRSFKNTVWTLQFVRSFILCCIFSIAAYPLSALYDISPSLLQVTALNILILGAASTSFYYMQRHMMLKQANLFEVVLDVTTIIVTVTLALIHPSVWAIMVANLISAIIRATASYMLPHAINWFEWNTAYVREVLSFGKWIFLSSLLAFLCGNFDKLFLAQAVPLALVGVYSIARIIADLPGTLIGRISFQLVFPLISASASEARPALIQQVSPLRFKLLLLAATSIAIGIATADFAITIVYDARYHDAGWMLSMLLVGAWFGILSTVNEYTMLGVGKPAYGVAGNLLKLLSLVVLSYAGQAWLGLAGVILAVIASELLRYFPIAFGQRRERISFLSQDLLINAIFLALIALLLFIRIELGYGTPFATVSMAIGHA